MLEKEQRFVSVTKHISLIHLKKYIYLCGNVRGELYSKECASTCVYKCVNRRSDDQSFKRKRHYVARTLHNLHIGVCYSLRWLVFTGQPRVIVGPTKAESNSSTTLGNRDRAITEHRIVSCSFMRSVVHEP